MTRSKMIVGFGDADAQFPVDEFENDETMILRDRHRLIRAANHIWASFQRLATSGGVPPIHRSSGRSFAVFDPLQSESARGYSGAQKRLIQESIMDALEAISKRRSIRDFLPDAPSRDKILTLVEAATCAPSAVNRQPWSFLVVRDRALLDKISHDAKAFMTNTRPLELPEQLYEKLADQNFHIFYRAPMLIVVAAEAHGPWIAEDCALAAENLMLAAHASGLGTCWIGLSQPFLSTQEGKQMIGLRETETPFAPIVVGYPSASPPHPPRKPPRLRWIG